MTQLSLPEPNLESRNELEQKYRAWKDDHPGVWALFEKYALQMLEKKQRFGVGMLAERVRWEVRTTWAMDEDGYKINNNHRSFIARDLIAKYHEMSALIEIRRLRGEEKTPE